MEALKTINQICIEADEATNVYTLSALWEYARKNGYSYSLVNLRFMKEHIEQRAREMGRKDAQEFKAWLKEIGN